MHRSRALVSTVLSVFNYRNGGSLVVNAGAPLRRFAVAAAADPSASGHSPADTVKSKQSQAVDASGAPLEQSSIERRPLRFATLQFLLQRRMPVNSVRLLASSIRLACDERRADQMVQYLGPWLAQLTRPETLERVMPWTITDILRDLLRLSRIVGPDVVRDALPSKHLQTLANRLVVQGFDKLTPLQLVRATEAFAVFRPRVKNFRSDQAAIDAENEDSSNNLEAWPSSDWVDELIDWLHNLKPNVEPWPRTSCYVLSGILAGLARSNFKPRQPTFQAAATALKAKLEEQLKTGYLSRQALINSGMAWNIWHVNPDEYAPGFWETYFKSAAQIMDEYVDTAPDPPSIEDLVTEADEEQREKGQQRPRFTQSLLSKRREFRSLLSTVALAAKNFNLSAQFNEHLKNIWEKRLDEHCQYLSGANARRVLFACDGADISVKHQIREKLMAIASRYGKRQNGPREDRDIDDFDDLRGTTREERVGAPGNSPSRGRAGREAFEDYGDFERSSNTGKGGRGEGRTRKGDEFDDTHI